jgi:hypothetical protein
MRRLFFCFALAVLYAPDEAHAQFTDARTYDNTPINVNQLELSYAYVRADASLDTSLLIAGAHLDLNQGLIDYTRHFGLFHRLMWVETAVPIAGLSGSVSGTNIRGSTTGAGDSSYQWAMLIKGGPATTVQEFQSYKPTTTLGMSLAVNAPTGSYNANRILNLGSDRWSFKPEAALTHPFGPEQRWEFSAYANVFFFSDNTTYRGREILKQQPLPGLEGHISYSLTQNVWLAFDTRYSFRGTTFLNGVNQNNAQQNVILGTEMNVSLNSRNSLLLEFAKAVVHQNGPALVGFSVKYDYVWGKGY